MGVFRRLQRPRGELDGESVPARYEGHWFVDEKGIQRRSGRADSGVGYVRHGGHCAPVWEGQELYGNSEWVL